MDRTFKRERPAFGKKKPKAGVTEDSYEDLQIKGIREELQRVRYNERFWRTLYTMIGAIIVGIAILFLITNLWRPVFRMSDNQMEPLIAKGETLSATPADKYHTGDIIAFHNNQKILVRRVVACEGEWVNISEDGTVYVNDIAIEEGYLDEKALGDYNVTLPCHVPSGSYFVLSDSRNRSFDSRNSAVGCVSEGQIIGKVTYRIWPPKKLLCFLRKPFQRLWSQQYSAPCMG